MSNCGLCNEYHPVETATAAAGFGDNSLADDQNQAVKARVAIEREVPVTTNTPAPEEFP